MQVCKRDEQLYINIFSLSHSLCSNQNSEFFRCLFWFQYHIGMDWMNEHWISNTHKYHHKVGWQAAESTEYTHNLTRIGYECLDFCLPTVTLIWHQYNSMCSVYVWIAWMCKESVSLFILSLHLTVYVYAYVWLSFRFSCIRPQCMISIVGARCIGWC